MNLKLAAGFILYWVVMGLIFHFGGVYTGDATSDIQTPPDLGITNYSTNDTGAPSANVDLSVWGAIKGIGQTIGFMFFGLGLPSDTPIWFNVIFIFFQSGISLLALLLALDAIHSG